jgi:hypothetical protein
MWMLDNQTPYGASRNWVRDKRGRHHWVVALRATFEVGASGGVTLSDEQPPPALVPEYVGEPGRSSLRWDSDLIYLKPSTDVLAEAWAHAPHGRPLEMMEVRLRVGPIDKRLLVFGLRTYRRSPSSVRVSSPVPFTKQAITYEQAYGGMDLTNPDPQQQGLDERNPIGRGFARDPKRLIDTVAPAVEYPNRPLAKAGPAGFGPLDPTWRPRRDHAGTYDETWAKRKRPLLPDDYDERFGCAAPEDQQSSHPLCGGEAVELAGLTLTGMLRFLLPKLHLRFTTRFGTRREKHEAKLVTVLLQPEAMRFSMVWQSSAVVAPNEIDYLDATRIQEVR